MIALIGFVVVVVLVIVVASMAAGRANRAASADEAAANRDRAQIEQNRETAARAAQTARENAERQARADEVQARRDAQAELARIRADAETRRLADEARYAAAAKAEADATRVHTLEVIRARTEGARQVVGDALAGDRKQVVRVTVGDVTVDGRWSADVPSHVLAAVELGAEAFHTGNGDVTHIRPAKPATLDRSTPPQRQDNRPQGQRRPGEPVPPVTV